MSGGSVGMSTLRIIIFVWLIVSVLRFLYAVIRGIFNALREQRIENAGQLYLYENELGLIRMANSKAFAWSLKSTIVSLIIFLLLK
jgi:hypothetical protein